jgi:hypothetical protein
MEYIAKASSIDNGNDIIKDKAIAENSFFINSI